MAKRETATIATELHGGKLYHERARAALPILVRQAQAGEPIFYEDLANELGMQNPRNLNYPLGSIGHTLEELGKKWKQTIPMIQSLVINQQQGMPGHGISGFVKISQTAYRKLTKQQRRELFKAVQFEVYAYRDWGNVLSALGLEPVERNFEPLVRSAQNFGGGGESEEHLRLKNFIKDNPLFLSIKEAVKAETEFRLASGDCLDVSFRGRKAWTAVEVKSAKSPEADIVRGVFQVVKYRAVMNAESVTLGERLDVEAMLVVEGAISKSIRSLVNTLGVRATGVKYSDGVYLLI